MFYYLRTTRRAGAATGGRRHELAAQPVGPAALAARWSPGCYIVWSVLPVADRDRVRVQQRPLAHDAGRASRSAGSRATNGSVLHDPALQGRARAHAAAGRDLRRGRDAARRLARARAAALARARQRHRQHADAAAARHARDRDGRRAAAAVPAASSRRSGSAPTAQAIGQVTFTLSYVVVIVRGRLVSIGPEYEEAAADLGAPPRDQLFRVLLPLLAPAILASAAIVVRALDRRLRRHAVPLERREHDDRLDAALRPRARGAPDPGAERDRDGRRS